MASEQTTDRTWLAEDWAWRGREIIRLRGLLTAWLHSGAMVGADLDKLRADTEEALNV
jgi:hypothetical protein